MNQDAMKKAVARAGLEYIMQDHLIGVGSGTTVNFFINELASMKGKIEGTVASSKETEKKLKQHGIPVYDLNSVNKVDIYIDSADEANERLYLMKGLGGALVREKIIAASAEKFICIIDESKKVNVLGEKCPLPIEVIPMARGLVARQLVKMGGRPVYREGYVTDNGNIILDIYSLKILNPVQMEKSLSALPGVVDNGIFARFIPDIVLIGRKDGVEKLEASKQSR